MSKTLPLPVTPERKPRVDAQRNRERIVEAAKLAFTQYGAEAALDDIARQAGVGSGTLYRHFANRDELIEAVYRSEVEKLTAAGQRFAVAMAPVEALRAWMLLFVDHVASKTLILPAMESVAGGSQRMIEGSRRDIRGTLDTLVERAKQSGDLQPETEAGDYLLALIGAFRSSAMPGWEASARRLVDILIAGSRARPADPEQG